jgi:hypothetical protein
MKLAGLGLIVAGLALGSVALALGGPSPIEGAPIVATRGVSPDATSDNGQRKLARTADGTLYLAYTGPQGGVEQAHVSFSLDQGQSWKPELTLGQPGIWSDLPTLAAGDNGRLDAAWVDYTSVGHVWHATMTSGAWSEPAKISPGPDYAGFPSMVITDGRAEVVWYAAPPDETREHGSAYEIHHTTGASGGWSQPVVLSSGSDDALNPSIALSPTGSLEAAWFQIVSGTYGAQHATFSDGEWTLPDLISARSQTATGVSLETGPESTIHLVWEQTDGLSVGVAYARYDGAEWASPEPLSESLSQDPVVAVDGQARVYVLWSENGQIKGRLWDGGWSVPSDLGPGTNPSLLSGDRVIAAWTRPAADSFEVVATFLDPKGSGSAIQVGLGVGGIIAALVGIAMTATRRVQAVTPEMESTDRTSGK